VGKAVSGDLNLITDWSHHADRWRRAIDLRL